MGLEGTLRVFSINDIFQVLGLQRKSGVLVVEGPPRRSVQPRPVPDRTGHSNVYTGGAKGLRRLQDV